MQQFSVNMPSLLIIGFLIGILFVILGNREVGDFARRNRLLKIGISIVGIMIPVTPLSWYGYWALTSSIVLMPLDYVVIAVAILIGVIVIYKGLTTYTSNQ